MNKAPQMQPLDQLAGAVRLHLQTLDLAGGIDFLSRLDGKLEPLLDRSRMVREELGKLVQRAGTAADAAGLRAANDRLVDLAEQMFLFFRSAPLVYDGCTVVREAIATRALELARMQLGETGIAAEVPMTLFCTGSDGRREECIFADQAYFFVYRLEEDEPAALVEECDGYFERLGSTFSDILDQAGISRRGGGIIPLVAEWRGSQAQWGQRIRRLVRYANVDWTKNMLDLIVLSDARYLTGDRELGSWFGPFVRSTGQNTPQTVINMARVACAMPVATGILRPFMLEGGGEHKGEFNLKLLAWKPLVVGVEVLAVSLGIEETATVERLARLQAKNCMLPKLSTELERAYHVISAFRIMQQIKKHKGMIDNENYINPYDLLTEDRDDLARALSAVEELQNLIRRRFSLG